MINDFRQIEAFIAVMSCRTLSEAAESLGISQPAVSNLIFRLEKNAGIALFTRSGNRLRPTEEARVLHGDAVIAMNGLASVNQTLTDLTSDSASIVTVHAHPAASLGWLPQAIATVRQEYPNTRFRITTKGSNLLWDLTHSPNADILIAETPIDVNHNLNNVHRLRCAAVLPRGHELEDKSYLTPADIQKYPFISLTPWQPTYSKVLNRISMAGPKLNIVCECEFFAGIMGLVASGAGLSIVEPIAAHSCLYRDFVTIREFRPAIYYEVMVVSTAQNGRSLPARRLLTAVLDLMSPHA